MSTVIEEPLQLCTFKLGNLLLGVDVLTVQEVIKDRPLTPVPQAPKVVQGLLNLRGQILTAIDLRKRLMLSQPTEELPDKRLIVIRTDSVNVALLVDSVGEVMEVTGETFEETTGKVPEQIRPFLQGVHNLEGDILHLLDAVKTSTLSNENTL